MGELYLSQAINFAQLMFENVALLKADSKKCELLALKPCLVVH